MRVAPNDTQDIISDIETSETSLESALQQVASGKRVTLASDDPTASANMVRVEADMGAVDQYTSNGSTALGAAEEADSILSSVTSQLTQAVTLGTEGANGTETASDRLGIAGQIQDILSTIVSDANTSYEGSELFAGSSGVSTAFVADASSPTGYTYKGNGGSSTIQIGENLNVSVTESGQTLFDNSSASVLGSLNDLVSALKTGSAADIASATASVSAALNYVSQQHAVYGSTIDEINAQSTFLSSEQLSLTSQQNNLVDVDTATAAETLSQDEEQNSAVLASAAKVMSTTLLDYLK